MKTRTGASKLAFLSSVLVLLLGCHSHDALLPANPPIGAQCAVEFRPPLPSGYSSLHLTGTLKVANDKWIVLYNAKKPDEGEVWIPREAIFALVTGKAAADFKGF